MRVAHFVQRYPPALGGSEAYFARLGRFLAQAGHHVTVFTSCADQLEAFWSWRGRCVPAGARDEEGVLVRRYQLLRWPGRRWLLGPLSLVPIAPWQCLTLPCNPICPGMWYDADRWPSGFDAVHATAFPYAFPILCARRLARRLNVPFLLTPFLHLGDPADPDDPVRRAYTARPFRWLLRQADLVFAQTPSERTALIGLGVPEDRVVLQGLGVDPDECTGGDRLAIRTAWGLGADDVAIGLLANQSREKGTIDLLLAAERLWSRGLPARVILAGPEMPNFRRFWADFESRGGHVRRLGTLDESGKRDFFAGIDVFALPSRSDSFGLVLLEAWANGVPNVGYRAGGVADVIRDEIDGFLVRCGDVDALADRLARLTMDVDLRRRLGEAGRARLPHDFAWADKLEVARTAMNPASRGA